MNGGLAAVVAVLDKRHVRYMRWQGLAAYNCIYLQTRCRVCGADISHGDRRTDGRAETAARHDADLRPIRVRQHAAFAYRRAAVGTDADAPPGNPLGKLPLNDGCARKSTLFPPPLTDRPSEVRYDRRGVRIDVVAIEAQTGFEPQRIRAPSPIGRTSDSASSVCATASTAAAGTDISNPSSPV